MKKPVGLAAALSIAMFGGLTVTSFAETSAVYDTVIEGGRVMDPESGLDAVRSVGIRDGKIAAISKSKLEGREVVSADGLVVAPGFIDLHAHGQDNVANALQALDGVTTAIDMELGKFPVAEAYTAREGNALLNFGHSASHFGIRMAAIADPAQPEPRQREQAAYRAADVGQLDAMLSLFESAYGEGALGVGFGLEYTPGAGRGEVYRIFQQAARFSAPVFVHVRRGAAGDPAPEIEAQQVQEVIADAAASGARLHICHVSSVGLASTGLILDIIQGAAANGVDITTEAYPYTAGNTNLGSALFHEGWQDRLGGIGYENLVWSETGERLTKATFEKYRAQAQEQGHGSVIVHVIPEDAMYRAVAHPEVIIASDGLPWATGGEHPRGAGTFARVLGYHVRERKDLDLMSALRKMTLLPARRLETIAPQMAGKGRIRVGADADLTIFDAGTIRDRATYEQPMRPSEGVRHVMVHGTWVVRDGRVVDGARPGQPIRGRFADEPSRPQANNRHE